VDPASEPGGLGMVAPNMGIFLHFFLNFAKIYGPQKICKTIHLASWGTAAGTYCRAPRRYVPARYCSTCYRCVGPVCFQNFVIFWLNSNGGKLYMKTVAFDDIYNFVVQIFSI
jgi:hypothetical protein